MLPVNLNSIFLRDIHKDLLFPVTSFTEYQSIKVNGDGGGELGGEGGGWNTDWITSCPHCLFSYQIINSLTSCLKEYITI